MPNYTQRAGQYIGRIDDDEQQNATKKTPTGIHLLDTNERIIDVLTNHSDKIYWDTKITEDQQDNLLTLDFTTLGTIDLTNVRYIVAQDQDGNHRLFVLNDIEKDHDQNGLIQIIHADGDHISLAQDQPIAPTTLSGATAETAAQYILTNSRYQLGQVDFLGSRTVKFTDFLSPLAALNQIASDFDAILRFRVEIIGNTIKRYVDILEPIDIFSGKEFVFGKDIIGLKRKENRADIVTRLVGYGPADEDGNFITFEGINDGKNYVEDADAYQRWNDGGRHRYGIFQYQPEDTTDVTPQKVLDATKDALKRRNDAVVEYDLSGAALEQIVGYEHEKVRVGMTIRIKDTYFEPALYLEAEVLRTETPELGDPNGEFTYTFGNYREVDISIPDDIKRIQSVLMKQQTRWTVAKDIADDAKQTAETAQQTADSKNKSSYGPNPPSNPKTGDIWFVTDGTDVVIAIRHWDGTQWVDDVDNEAVNQALEEAAQSAEEAKQQAQSAFDTATQATQDATNAINQAQTAFDNAQNALTATDSLANRMTDAEGNISALQQTSDSFATRITNAEGDISTLTQTVDGLQTTVSDVQGDVSTLTQTADSLQTRMTNAEGSISTLTQTTDSLTSQISGKADQSWVSSQISQLSDDINLRVSKDDIINQINLSTEGILIDGSKVHISGQTTFDAGYDPTKIGKGNNYIRNSDFALGTQNWNISSGFTDVSVRSMTGAVTRPNDDVPAGAVNYLRLQPTDANQHFVYQNLENPNNFLNKKLTLSFYQISGGMQSGYFRVYIQVTYDTASETGKMAYFNNNTNYTSSSPWRREKAIIDLSTLSGVTNISEVRLNIMTSFTGAIWLTGFQIEDGESANAWRPNPKDNPSLDWFYTGTTLIDGGKIYTYSITADKLSVTSLSAISANLGNITAGHIKGVTIEGSTIIANGGTNTVELTQYGLEVKSKGGNGTYISPGEGIGFGDYFDGNPRSSIYSSFDNTVTIQGKHLEVVSSVGNVLQLVGFGGASYIEFYRDAGTSRSGYFGVPSPSSADMGWTNLNGDINITPVTNVNINGHLTIEEQTFRIITDSDYGYIQTSRSEIRATKYGSGTLIPLRASSFPTGSLEEYKQDIQLWEDSAIDIIKNADLYQYRLKSDVEAGIDKVRHGFIIGDGYRTPEMVIDGDGVEQYAMNALSIKAIQELITRVENLERMVNA
jgi:phage minor structural protein